MLALQQAAETQKGIYQEWVQAKLGALDAYRQFYLENLRCQSISPQFQLFIKRGTIPEGCLPVAANSETLPYIVRTYILADAQFNTTTSQKNLDSYGTFKNDAENYFNIVKKLAFEPITRAQKKFVECMGKYASQSNQHPSQCADLLANLNRVADLQQQKYISPVYGPFIEKLYYIGQNNTFLLNETSRIRKIEWEKQGDVQAADVSLKYPQCLSSLQALKTNANAKLNAAYVVNGKITGIKSTLVQIEASLDAIIQKAKAATTAMYALLEQLKQSPN